MTASLEGLRIDEDAAAVMAYLVRHGAAAAGPDDAARPLTPAGREDVARLARALAGRGVRVAEIRHSGRLRAQETAEILGRALGPARGVRESAGLHPEDDVDIARAELELAAEPVMLVGHLPHVARLAAALLGRGAVAALRFDPATALGLARDAGAWRLAFVVTPAGTAPAADAARP